MIDVIAAYVLGAMMVWVPPQREMDRAGYQYVARDIARVSVEKPIFKGEDGAAKTALLLASVASFESRYEIEVDAFVRRGDSGDAWGLLQVHLRPGEACTSRLGCLRLGRERVRESFRLCKSAPLQDRLAGFTGGRCASEAARKASRLRMRRALDRWVRVPFVRPVS